MEIKMKKIYPLLSLLFLNSFGYGQKVYEVIGTYDNGSIKKIEYHQLIDNKIGLLKVVNFYENGFKKEERSYNEKGISNGLWTEWYDNGQIKSEGLLNSGYENGLWKYWYKNGKIKEEIIYCGSGEYDGLWTKWSENGEKTVETWVDGTQEGLSTTWYENGKKKEEGNYKYISYEKQLEKDGQWIYWDTDGEKIRQETYIDGEKTNMDIFKDGKIIISKSWGTLDF